MIQGTINKRVYAYYELFSVKHDPVCGLRNNAIPKSNMRSKNESFLDKYNFALRQVDIFAARMVHFWLLTALFK